MFQRLAFLLFLFAITVFPQPKPTPDHRTDAEINTALKAKLARSKIAADGFKFSVQGGIVYIDGQTGIPQHKGAATRIANTAGAKAVVNRIVVSTKRGSEHPYLANIR